MLEQSATVWHSSITQENRNDLERVQKTALKVILGEKYKSYTNALRKLDLQNLDERRENLCLIFARKTAKNPKFENMFKLNSKEHPMETRKMEKYEVQHANTTRLKNSSIIYMQNLLNQHEN